MTNLLDRYDELVAVRRADDRRLQRVLAEQEQVILAIDGLQPDVGHEVLWVVRDCLSGEILRAESLLSARGKNLTALLRQVREACPVPVTAVVSDGQPFVSASPSPLLRIAAPRALRQAVQAVFPEVPYELCQFHYLREAARPIYEADRHAKKELKKRVRPIRGIERRTEERADPEAEVIRGYCSAVRSALTDDGHPP